jgi:hypothetical protein
MMTSILPFLGLNDMSEEKELFDKVIEIVEKSSKFEVYIKEIIEKQVRDEKMIDLLFSEDKNKQLEFRNYVDGKYEQLKQMLAHALDRHEENWHDKEKFPQTPKELEKRKGEKTKERIKWLQVFVGGGIVTVIMTALGMILKIMGII